MDCHNETESCDIKYSNEFSIFDIVTYQTFFNCYGSMFLYDLFEIRCVRTCPDEFICLRRNRMTYGLISDE